MIDYTLPLDQLPDPLPIEPLTKPFDVTITPPGSKSITCRAYVLAALAEGESKIIRPLRADDTDHLLNALCTLGAEARWVPGESHDGEDVLIKGVAGRFPRGGNLYMGEGGTPTRFMIACACLAKEPVVIDASPRMRERPIAEGVDMLRQLGAKIEYVEQEGRLPVRVVPSEAFVGGEIEIGQTQSSQSVSALMLVGSQLERGVRLSFQTLTSKKYIHLTSRLMDDWMLFGLISKSGEKDVIKICRMPIEARDYIVELDASSCAYWYAAAALSPTARARMHFQPLASEQPDATVPLDMALFGSTLEIILDDDGPSGSSIIIGPQELCHENSVIDASIMPDGAMVVAVVESRARNQIKIKGLRTLRVKETDRIAALANELRKVGCTVETGEDWINITPPAKSSRLKEAASDEQREEDGGRSAGTVRSPSSSPSATTSKSNVQGRSSDAASTSDHIIIETYNDHRMAMAFAVLGLNAPNGVRLAIRNPKCVAKSYPGFWKDFAKLYR